MNAKTRRFLQRPALFAGVALCCLMLQPAASAAGNELRNVPGYVDNSVFVELAGGPEAVRVEVSIHPSLLKLVCASLEPDLQEVACGLKSLGAVILDLSRGAVGEARDLVAATERDLLRKGWVRMAMIKEQDSEVRVLILNDEKTISGLVVMVLDYDERELVFANVAGVLDLEAMQRIGEKLDIPGLEDLGDFQ